MEMQVAIDGFAERLVETMEARRLSQREVARRAGIAHSALHAATKSYGDPRAGTVVKIGNALGASLEWMLRGTLPMFNDGSPESAVAERRAHLLRQIGD
jgi:transcriptional regulator with XRE-family HTH domain